MRRRYVVAAAAAALVAGCAGEDRDEAATTQSTPEPVEELLAEIERTRPGVVLQDFARATARGDERRMWERLSAPSRRRLGHNLVGFRRDHASPLRQELAALGRRGELFLSQTITPRFAVAAIGRADRVYAAALRIEDGLWRIELGSPIRIEPLRPKPGETVARRTQLAAEVIAGSPLVEAGLWLDGLAFPTRGGGPVPSALTMFGETSRLSTGPHNVVAFASTAGSAAARAWTFRAKVR